MPACPRLLPRLSVWAVAVAVIAGALAAAPSALGISAPTGLGSSPPSPSTSQSVSFTWTAPEADLNFTIIDYEGGLAGAADSLGPDTEASFQNLAEGTHTFQVRAVEQSTVDGSVQRSAFASTTFRVDRTGPAISVSVPPPNGLNGWYSSPFTVDFVCSDPSGVLSCGPDKRFEPSRANQGMRSVTGTAADGLLNVSGPVTAGPFQIDMLGPEGAQSPSPGGTQSRPALIPAQPVFTWQASRPEPTTSSGLAPAPYELWLNGRAVAGSRRAGTSIGPGQYPALAEGVTHRWWVRTYDDAGNFTSTATRYFRINSQAPPAPVLTGGPAGPTNVSAPSFSWTGSGPQFAWEVLASAGADPVQQGTTTASSVALAALPDGGYTFRVSSLSEFGAESLTAERSFEVDTIAPAAPVITGRPPFPTSSATPAFAWTAEEGASFRWEVVGSGGASQQGPADSPVPGVTVGPLGPGAYSFRVSQVDPAGNASPVTSEPFAIVGPATVTSGSTRLPRRNAGRLRPRPGTLIKTRTPVVRWSKGPAGTTLYNLQLFRVLRRPAGRPPIVKKVWSAFPRGTQIRLPKRKVLAATCYVWRVWPYLDSRFTSQPLGISNFCVAKKAVLRRVARKAALRKKARRAALRRAAASRAR